MGILIAEELAPPIRAGVDTQRIEDLDAGAVDSQVIQASAQAVMRAVHHVRRLLQNDVRPVRVFPGATIRPPLSIAPPNRGQEPAPTLLGRNQVGSPQLHVMKGRKHVRDRTARNGHFQSLTVVLPNGTEGVTLRAAAEADPVFRRWWEDGVKDRMPRAERWLLLESDRITERLFK